MTKIEELRERKIAVFVRLTRAIFLTYGCHDRGIDELIDAFEVSCINLYRAEGKDELQALFDILWGRMTAWEEEWRAENPKERKLTSPDSIQLIEWKIAKAREEGADLMRTRILEQSYLKDAFNNPLVTLPIDFYIVPKSALTTKKTA